MAPAETATQEQTDTTDVAPQLTDSTETAAEAPPQKDWKEEYARLRKDYDLKNQRLNELESKPIKQEEPKKVTPESIEELKWELKNEEKVSLAGDAFNAYRTKGIPRDEALRLALQDKGIGNDKALAEHLRQAKMASAPSSIDRSGSVDDRTQQEIELDRRMGITPEARKKYAKRAEKMVQIVSF